MAEPTESTTNDHRHPDISSLANDVLMSLHLFNDGLKSKREAELPSLALACFQNRDIIDRMFEFLKNNISALGNDDNQGSDDIKSVGIEKITEIADRLSECVTLLLGWPPDGNGTLIVPICQHGINYVLTFILRSFMHCRESRLLYGGFFADHAANLSLLFKTTYNLQKSFSDWMEKVPHSNDAASQYPHLREGIHLLLDICQVLNDIDITPMINTWKKIKRILVLFGYYEEDQKTMKKLLDCLSAVILKRMETFCDSDETSSARLMKVLRFLWGYIIQVQTISGNAVKGEYSTEVVTLMLHMMRVCIVQLNSRICQQRRLCLELFSAANSVIQAIILECFSGNISNLIADANDVLSEDDLKLPKLMFFVHLIASIKAAASKEGGKLSTQMSSQDVFNTILHDLKEAGGCGHSLILSISRTPQSLVSVFDLCVDCLHSWILMQNDASFGDVEQQLLSHLLSNDLLEAMLARDVWQQVLSCASDAIVSQHVNALGNIILFLKDNHIPDEHASIQMISTLLNQILQSSAAAEDFHRSFKPSQKLLPLWMCISLVDLPDGVQESVASTMSVIVVAQVKAAVASKNEERIINGMKAANQILSWHQSVRCLSSLQCSALSDILLQLWEFAPQQAAVSVVFDPILALTTHLFVYMQPRQFQLILCKLQACLESVNAQSSLLLCCELLQCLRSTKFDKSSETVCLEMVISLFKRMFASPSWIMLDAALEAMQSFAESTPYAKVIPHCVPVNLQDNFKDHLNKVPYGTVPGESHRPTMQSVCTVIAGLETGQGCSMSRSSPAQEPLLNGNIRETDGCKASNTAKDVGSLVSDVCCSVTALREFVQSIPEQHRRGILPQEVIVQWNELVRLTRSNSEET